jgi:Ran GTPase-activating protein (RanGAP) involved in mRNA processing and transport
VSGGLESCKSLKELDLRHNAIGPEGAKALRAMLEKKNFVLATLEFSGNKLDAAEEAALVGLAAREKKKPAAKFKAPSVEPPPQEGDENELAKNGVLFDTFLPV